MNTDFGSIDMTPPIIFRVCRILISEAILLQYPFYVGYGFPMQFW